jgi:hypothetical protein
MDELNSHGILGLSNDLKFKNFLDLAYEKG